MKDEKNIPNFLIVGAPKSGTTALDHFLNQHPSIFMAKKELHFFGRDLRLNQEELSETNYLSYFKNAANRQIRGESSVWYLYSKKAHTEIKAFNPNTKIIILLRNPYEMIPSLHGQYLFDGDEKETGFELAFNNDLVGNTTSHTTSFKNRPPYIQTTLYYQQVKRYINTFGNEQVMVILHEEFKNNFKETYQNILNFLSVDNTFLPKHENINPRRKIKNIKLHQLSKNPPRKLKQFIRFLIPFKSIRHSMMQNLDTINIGKKQPTPISPSIKEKIIELTRSDIQNLEQLIQKDLSSWIS